MPRREQLPNTSQLGPYPGWDFYAGQSGPADAMPPPADSPGGGQWPGFSPSGPYYPGVDPSGPAFSDPFQPGFSYTGPGSGGYIPGPGGSAPYQPPSVEVTGATPNPSAPTPDQPYAIGQNPFGDFSNPFSQGISGGYNYYDAGNGVVYVYDQNWNYVGTTNTGVPGGAGNNPSGGSQPGGQTDPSSGPPSTPSVPSIPWYAGAGPYPGGNANPANPGYVAPRATTSDVYTPGQSGWEGTGSSFNFLLPGGLSAKNI